MSPFKALVAALSEARRQHPELSVTRVVIHKETEVSPDHVTSQVTGLVTDHPLVHGRIEMVPLHVCYMKHVSYPHVFLR